MDSNIYANEVRQRPLSFSVPPPPPRRKKAQEEQGNSKSMPRTHMNPFLDVPSKDPGLKKSKSDEDLATHFKSQYENLVREHILLKEEQEILRIKFNKLEKDYKKLQNEFKRNETEEDDEILNSIQNMKTDNKFTMGRLMMQFRMRKRHSKDDLERMNILKNEACFNTSLKKVLMDERQKHVPKLVVECIHLLENNDEFMRISGLYRVSGNHSQIQSLRFDINSNNYKALRTSKTPHEITGLLKMFFRELKEPIISITHLGWHIQNFNEINSKRERILKIMALVKSLDECRRKTLEVFIKHLNKVLTYPENEMNAMGLAIVTFSCIFNEILSDICPEKLAQVSALPTLIMQTMIECAYQIFAE